MTFLRTSLLSAAFIALCMAAVPNAHAEDGGKGKGYKMGHPMKMKKDMNRAEFMEHAGDRFDKMDADGDGVLTKGERKEMYKQMHEKRKEHKEKMLERFDSDGDGEISKEERKDMHKMHGKKHKSDE